MAKAMKAEILNLCGVGVRRYAVTKLKEKSSIPSGQTVTFSLKNWSGERDPKRGQQVELSGIEEFNKGWRASSASPIQL
jgi:hypothetical protein